jgi:hypothetical protein
LHVCCRAWQPGRKPRLEGKPRRRGLWCWHRQQTEGPSATSFVLRSWPNAWGILQRSCWQR